MESESWPVAVGGVGGSGTRVIAEVLAGMDVFMGNLVNHALDNLAWPLGSGLDSAEMAPPADRRRQSIAYALAGFEEFMLNAKARNQRDYRGWGWKVPTSFLWLDELCEAFPGLRYMHVIRHGLDMAYSRNRTQVSLWGHRFGVEVGARPGPEEILRYWVRANRHAKQQGEVLLAERFLMVNFDALCLAPETGLQQIAAFLGLEVTAPRLADLSRLIHTPRSMGRYRRQSDLSRLDPDDVRAVEAFGFPIERPLFGYAEPPG